jgi:hypothetical protein
LLETSKQKSLKGDANVDQKKQTQSTEKPIGPLTRFLQEPRKEGHFNALQEARSDVAGDTAFIGSWTGK